MKIQNISNLNNNNNSNNQNVYFSAKIITPHLFDEFKTAYGDSPFIDLGKMIKKMPFVHQGFITQKEAEKLLKLKVISKAEAEELLTGEILSKKETHELSSKITDKNIIGLHPNEDEQLTGVIKKIYSDIREELGLKQEGNFGIDLEPEIDLSKVKEQGKRKTITEIIQGSGLYKMLDDFITEAKANPLTKKEIEDATATIKQKEQEIEATRINLLA